MNDSYETKAAVLAAKENSNLPVIVSNAYGEDGKLMTGAAPAAMVAMLEGMGADAIGANCSLGPRQLRGVAEELLQKAAMIGRAYNISYEQMSKILLLFYEE